MDAFFFIWIAAVFSAGVAGAIIRDTAIQERARRARGTLVAKFALMSPEEISQYAMRSVVSCTDSRNGDYVVLADGTVNFIASPTQRMHLAEGVAGKENFSSWETTMFDVPGDRTPPVFVVRVVPMTGQPLQPEI